MDCLKPAGDTRKMIKEIMLLLILLIVIGGMCAIIFELSYLEYTMWVGFKWTEEPYKEWVKDGMRPSNLWVWNETANPDRE